MDRLVELLRDDETAAGRAVTSLAVVAGAVLLAWVVGRVVGRRVEDAVTRYHARKAARYGVAVIALVALAVVWRPFAGRIGVVVGLAAAGIAFAMQEVIGAIAGWFNILSGRIFRVGDRIEMGGVRGDVIDITPLRTKILEIGSAQDDGSWVRGRQLTGRIVAVSNKATFTDPVFNFSASFDYIWEELAVPVPHDADWRTAERILREEAEHISASRGAREAIDALSRRYPLPRTEMEPRVFVRATDDWMELSARFVVPVRSARAVIDDLTRRVHDRLDAAGVRPASRSLDVRLSGAREVSPAPLDDVAERREAGPGD
jgi:small-conductance mechanosensitive channel